MQGPIDRLSEARGHRAGATVAVLLASGRIYARVYVSEPMRTRLTIGSRAEVRLDGFTQPLIGHLRWIASSAAFTPYFALNQHDRSRLSYLAEVDLDTGSLQIDEIDLPVGVPVEVTFPGLTE